MSRGQAFVDQRPTSLRKIMWKKKLTEAQAEKGSWCISGWPIFLENESGNGGKSRENNGSHFWVGIVSSVVGLPSCFWRPHLHGCDMRTRDIVRPASTYAQSHKSICRIHSLVRPKASSVNDMRRFPVTTWSRFWNVCQQWSQFHAAR